MRLRLLLLTLAALLMTACGSGSSGTSAQSAATALSSLPATLEGKFSTAVGSSESDGSPTYFGSLEVEGEEVGIKVSGAVLDAAGIPHADDMPSSGDGKVRATLGSKTEFMGETYYVVSALQRL